MKKIIFYFILFFVVTSWLGCNGNSKFRERLVELDSNLISHPDSVYNILQGMRDEAKQQSHVNRMYYELISADAQNKTYIDFTTDSIMIEVADYYEHHGTSNEKMRAYYLLGCTYRDLNDIPMELQCFLDATEKADTSTNDCDLYTLYAIYSQMADLYEDQHLPREELRALKACEEVAIKDNDIAAATKAYELRLCAYYLLNMPDSVLSISEEARRRYLAFDDIENAACLLGTSISILLDREEYDKAYEYMQIFKKESGYFTNNEINSPSVNIFYRSMGRYALHCDKLDSARYYFDKLIECNLMEAGYDGLLRLYQKTGNADSIVKYSRLFAIANDSSHIGKNIETVSQINAMFNYGREKRIAENAKERLLAEKSKTLLLIGVVVVLVMLILLILYAVNRIRKHNVTKIVELNREIEHKKRLLEEASRNQYDDRLVELEASLEKALTELSRYKKSDMLAAFFESDIYKLFKKLSLKGGDGITQEEWNAIARLFDSTFSHYIDFIHSGKSMTPDQVRVCMLIRMGFGETEMANILNVDIKRITRIKVQINQKLFNSPSAKDLVSNLKRYF